VVLVSRPLRPWKVGLVAAMIVSFVAVLVVPPLQQFFAFELPPPRELGESLVTIAVACVLLSLFARLAGWRPQTDSDAGFPPAPPVLREPAGSAEDAQRGKVGP